MQAKSNNANLFSERSVFVRLVNAKKSDKELEEMPHRKFLDLAVIYEFRIYATDGYWDYPITTRMMEEWGLSEKELFELGMKNMWNMVGHGIYDCDEVLAFQEYGYDLKELEEAAMIEPDKFYTFTAQPQVYGAVNILYPELLHRFGEVAGSDYYILPCSVNEILMIIPGEYGLEDYIDLVRCGNRKTPRKEEILSNHVYMYHRDTGLIEIMA